MHPLGIMQLETKGKEPDDIEVQTIIRDYPSGTQRVIERIESGSSGAYREYPLCKYTNIEKLLG